MPRSRMEMIRKQSSRNCSGIQKPNLSMPVALLAVVSLFESNAHERFDISAVVGQARRLPALNLNWKPRGLAGGAPALQILEYAARRPCQNSPPEFRRCVNARDRLTSK